MPWMSHRFSSGPTRRAAPDTGVGERVPALPGMDGYQRMVEFRARREGGAITPRGRPDRPDSGRSLGAYARYPSTPEPSLPLPATTQGVTLGRA